MKICARLRPKFIVENKNGRWHLPNGRFQTKLSLDYIKPDIIFSNEAADGRNFSSGRLAKPAAGKWLASAKFSRSPS